MKRLLWIVLAVVVLATACSGESDDNADDGGTDAATSETGSATDTGYTDDAADTCPSDTDTGADTAGESFDFTAADDPRG